MTQYHIGITWYYQRYLLAEKKLFCQQKNWHIQGSTALFQVLKIITSLRDRLLFPISPKPLLFSHFSLFFYTLCWQIAVAFGQVNAVLVSLCPLKSSLHSLSQACVSASRIYSLLQLLALSVPHQIFPSLSMQSPGPSQSQLGLHLPWPCVLSSLWECLMSTSGPVTSCASSSQLQPASSACLLLAQNTAIHSLNPGNMQVWSPFQIHVFVPLTSLRILANWCNFILHIWTILELELLFSVPSRYSPSRVLIQEKLVEVIRHHCRRLTVMLLSLQYIYYLWYSSNDFPSNSRFLLFSTRNLPAFLRTKSFLPFSPSNPSPYSSNYPFTSQLQELQYL